MFETPEITQADPEIAAAIVKTAVLAADMEALSPPPVSRVRNPDGSAQGETGAERTRRIVETAVMHLIEQGLLAVPGDIAERLERPIPIARSR